jgi:hypothetical protein
VNRIRKKQPCNTFSIEIAKAEVEKASDAMTTEQMTMGSIVSDNKELIEGLLDSDEPHVLRVREAVIAMIRQTLNRWLLESR